MTSRLTRIQLSVFVAVTLAALVYGATRFFDVDDLIYPPYEVMAVFEHSGGIYPRADVDLLGTRVGSVTEVRPGPGDGTTLVLAIDDGVEIPRDVTAQIGNKSAIGEQYVELVPTSTAGPHLGDGDTIPRSRTVAPLRVEQFIGHINALAGSIPTDALTTVLDEMAVAVTGTGSDLGRLLDGSNRLTRASLESVDSLTALIEEARMVLDTQVVLGPQTATYLRELAPLLEAMRSLNPEVASLFTDGARAGEHVTALLTDIEQSLPSVLDNLVALNAIFAERLPSVRKTLVVFPWSLELISTIFRSCTDVRTDGSGVEQTCDYDANGRPRISAHIALQSAELPGRPPYHPCTQGYEATTRYQPDGAPVDGDRPELPDEEPNLDAICTASPYDPVSPNVRGPRNIPGYTDAPRVAPGWGLAVYDQRSGLVVAPDGATVRLTGTTGRRPPAGDQGLAWLLTQPMAQ